ncbi:PKD domain-containing protein [Bythopirellula goksoeyrii]|nr:PKD domain-containing protein [Bythopirellula goksoeyrii]
MSRQPNRKPHSGEHSRLQFELLETRHLFSVSPLGPALVQPGGMIDDVSIIHMKEPTEGVVASGPTVQPLVDVPLTNFLFQPMIWSLENTSVNVFTSLQLNGDFEVNIDSDLTIQWTKISGPGDATFNNASAANTTVQFDQVGTYELQLEVTNHGQTSVAFMTVDVTAQVLIPELDSWLQNMISYGQQHGDSLANYIISNNPSGALGATYYDAARVFYQIADHTGDSSWNAYAEMAITVYRDNYVLPNDGGVPGYWNFSRGLVEHFERTGDDLSRVAAISLSHNAAFAADGVPLSWTESIDASREVAYSMMSYLDAELLGEPRRDRLGDLFEQALGHLDQWFIEEADPTYAPFMFALTADALMQYYERVDQDPRILEKLLLGAEWTWNHAWKPEDEAFWYRLSEQDSAPDLNLLIAPVYEWLYQETGNMTFRNQADSIFAGGVKHSYLNGPKQFNQNYRVSFDYVAMRQAQTLQQTDTEPSSIVSTPEKDLGFTLIGMNQLGYPFGPDISETFFESEEGEEVPQHAELESQLTAKSDNLLSPFVNVNQAPLRAFSDLSMETEEDEENESDLTFSQLAMNSDWALRI